MYTFNSRIRYSEIDNRGTLTPQSLMNYYQDCSTFQTQDGKATMEVMKERNLAWVVSSWQVVINRLPKLGERVVIGTVPYELKGFIGMRNFFMDTEEGERLSVANSVWSLIDIERGVPSRITPDIVESYPLDDKLQMDYAPRKLPFPDRDAEDSGTFSISNKIEITKQHLDTNQHVNNAQYITLAFDAIGDFDYRTLKQIRAEYKKQSHLGDIIVPVVNYKKTIDNIYTVSLQDETGDIYCNVELIAR